MTLHKAFFEQLQEDRKIDVLFWDKHPELKSQFVDNVYPDRAHVIYELLQNAEDTAATHVDIALFKDRFTFKHNGTKLFTESNIQAITDVSKSDKVAGIRRFGIGFKSVFKYTDTPCIYSGSFSFRIINFVYPEVLEPVENLGANTYFVFPFKDAKRLEVYVEIEAGLKSLAETTLLFLSNIESISWRIGDSDYGEIRRRSHSENHVEVQTTINGTTKGSSHFLRFDEPMQGQKEWRVALAFALKFLPKAVVFKPEMSLATQMEIVPAKRAKVAILFPAEREASGLQFHLHAPFEPELSRASIKETPANTPLFQQLAKLAAASLHRVRDLERVMHFRRESVAA